MKDIFNINDLDLAKVALSFGLSSPPNVNLNYCITSRRKQITDRKKPYMSKVVYLI